ncbi:hypothetical protein PHMEG_00025515 [Phytophthora megakarya]|uniref:Integrase zinc-binding domain-containing protein n=1 Tax=Phytophthora megakarya TaxID=4795 RepID=A0A225VBV6_9STRA|nr:hypothetical protein PHMEG_00025515 [Phytophthora megakarya]
MAANRRRNKRGKRRLAIVDATSGTTRTGTTPTDGHHGGEAADDTTEGTRGPDDEDDGSGGGQLTDAEIRWYQAADNDYEAAIHKGLAVVVRDGRVHLRETDGSLWALREAHDSIYACHLGTPQTYGRLENVYRWPGMRDQVKYWRLRDEEDQTEGSYTTAPKFGIGDRRAIDVAGPLPTLQEEIATLSLLSTMLADMQ